MMVKELRDALVEAGAAQTTAEAAAAAVLERSEAFDTLLTKAEFKADMSGLRAELYRALLIHGSAIIAVVVSLKIFG